MLYQATHITRYRYEEAVAQCVSEARLAPRGTARQRVRGSRIHVHPEPTVIEERADYFGNRVTAFTVFHRHEVFLVRAESIVEVDSTPPVGDGGAGALSWEEARAAVAEARGDDALAASEFLYESPFVAALGELAEYGRPSFTPGRPLTAALGDLNSRIHREFRYQPKTTAIDMPLAEVFAMRRGVCQDFAHVMIGVLRAYGIPARYVSGYLRSGVKFQGAEASHAWASAFVPGLGWLDLDPTNNVIPSEGHVTVAWGRDYGDVTPIKGISLGGGRQTVEVEVTVRPLESAA